MHGRLIRVFAAVMAVTAAVAWPAVATANIVNIQGSLASEPAEGWSGSVGASADWRTGNTDLVQVGGTAAVLYRNGRVLTLALARGEYGEGEGTPFSERSFEHLRLRVALDDRRRWMWEAFGQHEYDAFRRLEVRALVGTGPALRVIDQGDVWAVIGVAYLAEYERFDDGPYPDASDSAIAHRVSSYATGTYALDDRVSASQTVYLQPRVDRPSDFRFLSESSVTTRLKKWLALQSSFVVAVDRTPPASVDGTDTQLKTSLTVSW
jgi:hypothetical protein